MRRLTGVLVAAPAVTLWLALAVAAPAPAAGEPATTRVDLTVRYTCEFPAGPQPVELRITADLPAAGAVGEPIQPSSVGLSLTMPPPGLPGVASLTALARLDTTVTQLARQKAATWSGALSTPVPVADPLVLDLPVDTPPPVVASTPGDVVLTAAGLALTVDGYQADGTITEPPAVEATCAPDADQRTKLATVPVSVAMAPSSEAPEPPPPGAVVVEPESPPERSIGTKAVEIPPDCHIIDPPTGPATAARYCAYVTGYANVAKLDAAVEQPPGITNIGPTSFYVPCEGDSKLRCQQANILPNLGGEPVLPETESSFLAFGFVPVKAKMQLTQIGLSFADVKLDAQAPHARSGAVITGKYVARIYDASVNGVPFDLGPACQTAKPLEISVRANVPPYTLTLGGLLDGMVTIPEFSGCGVTEDLDPLITGMVSGPDNYVRLTQGRVCTLTGAQGGCPPQIPTPQ